VPETATDMSNLPQRVMVAVSAVKPIGVRFNVRIAERVSINIEATITLPMGLSENLASGVRNQASLFVKRYLNSLTVGDMVSMSEIERQIKLSSDYIRSCYISAMLADGSNMPLVDFSLDTVKKYPVAGAINISSVIMGGTNY